MASHLLALARCARILAPQRALHVPLPLSWCLRAPRFCRVGCVIVGADGEEVLAEGFHERKGGKHAEAAALADVEARGVTREQMSTATCYVTLEPCHRGPGKTTPPCDEALVASGLRQVHVALVDPDPAFGGGAGVEHLEAHGITVTVGTARDAIAASLRPYLHQRATGMPWVVLKVASTADGAIACADGTSQWITGPAARAHSQLLRAASQAILVGSGTALADAPRLTLRLDSVGSAGLPAGAMAPARSPLRVLLDARGRVASGPLLDTSLAPTLIFSTAASRESAARAAWAAAGIEVCEVPAAVEGGEAEGGGGGGVDLPSVLRELGTRGVIQLMVEGGGAVHGAFLADQHGAQQLRLYIGATALGSTSRRWIQSPIAATIGEAPRWSLLSVQQLGDDVCLDYALASAREREDGLLK